MKNLTLPVDSKVRKTFPMYLGLLAYFPAALAGVAKVSYDGNKKHNGGLPPDQLQHSRWKSTDHEDCIVRHLVDSMDLLRAFSKNDPNVTPEQVLTELSCLAWRALALSQEMHEALDGAPPAPAAKFAPEEGEQP